MKKSKAPSINSEEFKIWKEWFSKQYPEDAWILNDQDIYDIYVLGKF